MRLKKLNGIELIITYTLRLQAALTDFSHTLAQRERWLILNKVDLLDPELLAQRRREILDALGWDGPVYEISAIKGDGTDRLCADIMAQLETWGEQEAAGSRVLGE